MANVYAQHIIVQNNGKHAMVRWSKASSYLRAHCPQILGVRSDIVNRAEWTTGHINTIKYFIGSKETFIKLLSFLNKRTQNSTYFNPIGSLYS